jgi:hypothetical protein
MEYWNNGKLEYRVRKIEKKIIGVTDFLTHHSIIPTFHPSPRVCDGGEADGLQHFNCG